MSETSNPQEQLYINPEAQAARLDSALGVVEGVQFKGGGYFREPANLLYPDDDLNRLDKIRGDFELAKSSTAGGQVSAKDPNVTQIKIFGGQQLASTEGRNRSFPELSERHELIKELYAGFSGKENAEKGVLTIIPDAQKLLVNGRSADSMDDFSGGLTGDAAIVDDRGRPTGIRIDMGDGVHAAFTLGKKTSRADVGDMSYVSLLVLNGEREASADPEVILKSRQETPPETGNVALTGFGVSIDKPPKP